MARDIHIEAAEGRASALQTSGVQLLIAVLVLAMLTAVIIVGVGALQDRRASCEPVRSSPPAAAATPCR